MNLNLDNLDPAKTIYNPIDETHINWDQTTRSLTTTGTIVIVAAIVAASIVTAGAASAAGGAAAGGTAAAGGGAAAGGAAAGAGAASATAATATATTATAAATAGTVATAGVSTAAVAATATAVTAADVFAAMGTAALVAGATTAATTATLSGINASMNADGDIFKQLKTTANTSYQDTTSRESIKNIALSAAIAAAAAGAITAFNGSPNLETGSFEDSKVGVNTVKGSDGNIYKEAVGQPGILNEKALIDVNATGIGDYNCLGGFCSGYDNNPILKSINTIPSAQSGAKGHDVWVDKMQFGGGLTGVTAPPYLIMNMCAAAPSLCAIYIDTKTDKNFLKPNN